MKVNLIGIFLICFFSILAQDCPEENTTFQDGERITFRGAYNWGLVWLNAGEATFKVTEETLLDQPVYHVVGDGKTYESYDWFFKVRDKYETYIHTNSLLPLRFVRNVSEGNFTLNNQYTFNQEENTAHIDYIKKKGRLKRENETLALPNCTHDVLSAVMFVRNLDFQNYTKGDSIFFSIFLDAEVFNVSIVYQGEEEIKLKKGDRYNTFKFTFELIAGTIFEEGQTMTVWATADRNKVPLVIESPLIVGSAKFYMLDYEGLKYPMEALIEK